MAEQHRPLETDGIEEAADEAGVTVGRHINSLVHPGRVGAYTARDVDSRARTTAQSAELSPNPCSSSTAGPVPAAKYRTGRPSTVTTRSILAAPAADPKSDGTDHDFQQASVFGCGQGPAPSVPRVCSG